MAKKDTGADAHTTQDDATVTTALKADQAFTEIQSAAKEGAEVMALAAADGFLSAPKVEEDTRTPEQIDVDTAERRKRFKQRATKQREMGLVELEKVYGATMTVPVELKVYDRVVASMVERFLGSVDRSLHVVNRFGESVMSSKQTADLLEVLKKKFDELEEEAKLEFMKAKARNEAGRANFKKNSENFDIGAVWLEATYPEPTISRTFSVKHPYTMQLVKAINMYDKAIEILSVLNFNGEADAKDIATLQDRQKMLIKNLFVISIRSVTGMYKRTGQATAREQKIESAAPANSDALAEAA